MLRADRIRELREQHGLSQRELAERIGRHQVDVSRIESGRLQAITIETLGKLADVLGVSTDYLLGRDVDEDSPSDVQPADLAMVGA
jgi:transcriptional regulator with XRE-family HTH domain